MQVFTKGMRSLITVALIAFSFFKEHVLEIMGAAFLIALTIIVIRKFVKNRHWFVMKYQNVVSRFSSKLEAQKRARHYREQKRREAYPAETNPNQAVKPESPAATENRAVRENAAALRHLNLRITERVHTIFPKASWDWSGGNPTEISLSGGMGRICIYNADIYNNADVMVNPLGELHLTMLQAVKFEDLACEPKKSPDEGEREEESAEQANPPVNISAWCDLVGRDPLYELSARLFEKGYQRLTIDEVGTVYASDGESETEQAQLENMPPKKFWDELAKQLSDEFHQVTVDSDRLVLGW